jgi:hypothetical protein
MNENLERRMIEARKLLEDGYAPKKRKWYQQKLPTYELITDVAYLHKKLPILQEEIIIKNELKTALRMSAFFVAISVTLVICKAENWYGEICMFAIINFLVLTQALDRRPKLILTRHYIWGYNFEEKIYWEDIIAIYLKTDDSGESVSHSLFFHYYDRKLDYFKEIEFKLTSFDMDNDDIIRAIKIFAREM